MLSCEPYKRESALAVRSFIGGCILRPRAYIWVVFRGQTLSIPIPMRFPPLLLLALCLTAFAGEEEDQFNFAEGLFIQQDYLTALEEYETYQADFPQGKSAGTAAFRVAECQLRMKDYVMAAGSYQKALAAYPESADAPLGHYNLGRACLQQQQLETASAAFAEAARSGDGRIQPEALIGLGECQVSLEELTDAVQTYQQFVGKFPLHESLAAVRFSLGWCYLQLEQPDKAIPVLESLLQETPKGPDAKRARLALSEAYTELQQFDRAASTLQSVEAEGDSDGAATLRKAWMEFQAGNKERACDGFIAYLERFPQGSDRVSARYNAGVSAYEAKQYERALEQFTQLHQEAPASSEDNDAQLWRGLCAYELAEFQQAIDYLEPLTRSEATEQRESLWYSYAESLAGLGKAAEAVQAFDRLLAEFATGTYDSHARYSRALALEASHQRPLAITGLKDLLKDELPAELKQKALFALSEYLYRAEQAAEAIGYLQQLVTLGRPSHQTLYRLGWAAFKSNALELAETQFRTLAASKNEFTGEAAFMLGRIGESRGDLDAAEQAYRDLMDRTGEDPYIERAWRRMAYVFSAEALVAHVAAYGQRFPEGQYREELQLRLAEDAFARDDVTASRDAFLALLPTMQDAELRRSAEYGLAWAHLNLGELDKAEALFASLSQTDCEWKLDSTLQLGEIAFKREHYEQALPFFDIVVAARGKESERGLYMRGWTLRELNRPKEAGEAFLAVQAQFPQGLLLSDAVVRASESLNTQGRAAESVRWLTGLPEERKTEAVWHALGDSQVLLKAWDQVIQVSETLLANFAESEQIYLAYFRRGLARQALGIHNDAISDFRATIDSTDTRPAAQAQFNIGTVLVAQGDHARAARQFLRVEMLFDYPDLSPRALYEAVQAFRAAGPDSERRAKLYAGKLRETYPDSEWAKKLPPEAETAP